MMRLSFLALTMVFCLLVVPVGCSSNSSPTGSEQGSTATSAKSDCPDCDPAGPNAFIQTNVGGTGFYATGDHWQVAFRYNHSPVAEMRDVFLGEDRALSDVFLFDYEVLAIERGVFNNVLREVATVEITQAALTGTHSGLFAPQRVDDFEFMVSFEMKDLREPVAEKVFNRRYPHGKRVRLDSKASLKTGGSIFPRTIPRLLVEGALDYPAPDLPADLEDVVDSMSPSWRDTAYKRFDFENGDVLYWAQERGQYWPFYVKTSQGEGVLVSWN